MRRVIYILCGAYAAVGALFAFQENPLLQLLFMLLLLGLLVSFVLSVVHSFRFWPQLRWRALLPFAACVLVFLGATEAGRVARDIYFRTQIPRLEDAVRAYRSSGQWPEVSWHGYGVVPSKFGEKDTAVLFWWGGGFPVKHTALVYYSADDPKSYFREGGWRRGYPVKDHWWVVKD